MKSRKCTPESADLGDGSSRISGSPDEAPEKGRTWGPLPVTVTQGLVPWQEHSEAQTPAVRGRALAGNLLGLS